ncbi:hypothetical protein [Mucilaginibacter pedocola]|uniref:Uncharacterized protein n=1 Tax=Mucilaginibacter pedocola TaxID=1792845 RepID=A0A1S9PF85_9SPHI|nr:hypothetical protein [Mucilaginibacter pedocola]OOQ59559.1 hypothetical protein BC343_05165 [Mucilaginibacter pedocola]
MNDYRKFEQVKTTELFITKNKWFYPYYELTDGQFIYGKLSYKGHWRRHAVIETADGLWTVKQKGWFKRAMLINRNEDETIGTMEPQTWKRDTLIKLDDGFEGNYLYKKLFTNAVTLVSDTEGDILRIATKAFGIKKPFTIEVDPSPKKVKLNIPLLVLAGVNLILLRQAQAAAAASA